MKKKLKFPFILSIIALIGVSHVQAQSTIRVPDDYPLLSSAIAAASHGDTILIDGIVTEQGILINKNLTIRGIGMKYSIIQASVFRNTASNRVIKIDSGFHVILEDLTIRHGNISDFGSGIYTRGRTVLRRVRICSNDIYNNTFIGGAGLFIGRDSTFVTDCIIDENSLNGSNCQGGGINNDKGVLLLERTAIVNNVISGNDGSGAGLYSNSTSRLLNSTLGGNIISGINGYGGGIAVHKGTVYVSHCTVNDNIIQAVNTQWGGGIFTEFGSMNIKSSLIADNIPEDAYNQTGSVNSFGYNLVEAPNNVLFAGPGDIINQDPSVNIVGSYGGYTLSSSLNPGSMAIDAGATSDLNGNSIIKDQRDFFRDAKPDIGAFEYGAAPKIKAVFLIRKAVQCQKGNDFEFLDNSHSVDTLLQYNWDFDNNGRFDDASGTRINHTFSKTGILPVGLQVINASNDTDIYYKNVLVLPSPKACFAMEGTCEGQKTFFYDSSQVFPGGTILKRYWDVYDDGSIEDSTLNYSHTIPFPGQYRTSLRVIADNNCEDIVRVQFEYANKPLADFHAENFCLDQRTRFYDSSSIQIDSIISYTWYFDDGDTSLFRNTSHIYNSPNDYQVRLVVESSKNCFDTATKKITIFPLPVFSLQYSKDTSLIFSGDTLGISVKGNGIDSVFWSTGARGFRTSVGSTGKIFVIVKDSNACINMDSAFIEIKQKTVFDANNIITPNDDGINDKWVIRNINSFSPCTVKIYNRYGEVVYESANYQNNWDGTRKGAYLPEGTYFFILKAADGTYQKGTVNILH